MRGALAGKTVAMTFSKRSTRTRVSTEGAIAAFGGSPMFLGKDDIQLGVWQSLLLAPYLLTRQPPQS
jgi:ornithine carbamoyltransferase